MEFELGKTLTSISPNDKPWTAHRRENSSVSSMYAENAEFYRLAARMWDCAQLLVFGEKKPPEGDSGLSGHDSRLKLTKARFCRVRHCPVCAWRKSLALKARFLKNLPAYLAAFPDFAYLHVVLTVKNPPMADLRSVIKSMNAALKKALKRDALLSVVKGYIKSIEVTRGGDGNPHPHIHLVLAVLKSYFKTAYIKQADWVKLWRSCLGVDYDPLVSVQRIKLNKRKAAPGGASCNDSGALISGMVEVVKYGTKPADLVSDPAFLYGLTVQVRGMRFLEAGGCFKGIFKDVKTGKDTEDVDEEDMLLKSEDGDPMTDKRLAFRWEDSDYRLRRVFTEKKS